MLYGSIRFTGFLHKCVKYRDLSLTGLRYTEDVYMGISYPEYHQYWIIIALLNKVNIVQSEKSGNEMSNM